MAPPVSPEDRFYGAFLMAIGSLIAGLCGACTLVFSLGLLRNASLAGLLLPLIVGGLPTLAGVLLIRAGFRRFRGGRNPDHRGIFD